MPNKRYSSFPKGGRPATGQRGSDPSQPPTKTTNWPGAPGKKRKKNFSSGMPKIKEHVKDDC